MIKYINNYSNKSSQNKNRFTTLIIKQKSILIKNSFVKLFSSQYLLLISFINLKYILLSILNTISFLLLLYYSFILFQTNAIIDVTLSKRSLYLAIKSSTLFLVNGTVLLNTFITNRLYSRILYYNSYNITLIEILKKVFKIYNI